MDLFRDVRIDFMKYRKFWIIVSLALLAAGVFSIFVHGKLNLGVDFAGGTQLTLAFRERPDLGALRGAIAGAGIDEAQIQRFGEEGDNEVLIKTPLVEGVEEGSRDQVVAALDALYDPGAAGVDLNSAGRADLVAILLGGTPEVRSEADLARQADAEAVAEAVLDARRDLGLFTGWEQLAAVPGLTPEAQGRLRDAGHLGSFAVLGVESVGPQIGEELRQKGVLAVILSLIGMLVYIWLRFELRFGIGALMATLHDVLICLFFYALAGFEFNLTTIAAFLTLVGYSVNDTVVVFDRVRENMRKTRRMPLLDVMNLSINQTLARTILTSGTTLLAVGALLAFGGDVLRGFAFVMTIGVIVGTYSTIYIASAFAILWEQLFGAEARARRQQGARRAAV